jgi:hypothetical protein
MGYRGGLGAYSFLVIVVVRQKDNSEDNDV